MEKVGEEEMKKVGEDGGETSQTDGSQQCNVICLYQCVTQYSLGAVQCGKDQYNTINVQLETVL